MFIKSIELDGFKSYAKRTVVDNFDNLFNAITGLNGSGKSNILDSICFLLGISQLSHVRASSLTELVYKNGQAGVTRATVSITFDNTDKEGSPVGYNSYDTITVTRQINIGGKNKYLINGVNVQNNKVSDFFQSIGLNINNPHFLIMQGRVTKVMNMKPMEILSMIEEATGTRMYEQKRESSSKLAEKKQLKWAEITSILEDDLQPKINKLKADREAYLEFQRLGREIEQNEKIVIAFKYTTVNEKLAGADAKEVELKEKETVLVEEKTTTEGEIDEINQLVSQMNEQNQAEKGEKMAELEAQLSSRQKDFAKKQAAMKGEQEKLKQHQKQADSTKKQLTQIEKQLEQKKQQLTNLGASHEQNQASAAEAEEDFTKAETMLEQLRVGAAGGAPTIAEEAMEKRQIVAQRATEIKTGAQKQKTLSQDVAKYTKQMTKSSSTHQADVKQLGNIKTELARVDEQLSNLNFDESSRTNMVTRLNELDAVCQDLGDQRYNFFSRFDRLDIEQLLRLPRDFDRTKIKGLVANLLQVNNMDYVAAIEKAAGQKLYNLVVDSSATAQFLMKNKCLKRQVTMIPLDRIRARAQIDPRKVQLGKQRVGAQNCFALRSLVRSAPEFNDVLDFCFNGVMVARTNDMAHDLCFSREIHTRCLSAGGDDFSPDGVLSGGRKESTFVLKEKAQLDKIERQLEQHQQDQYQVKKELESLETNAAEFARLDKHKNAVSAKQAQLETRLASSEFGQLQQEHDRATAELELVNKQLEVAQAEHDKCLATAEDIEQRMKNLEKNRDKELKKLQKEVDAKRKLRDNAVELVDQANFEGLALEIEELEKEGKSTTVEIEAASAQNADISAALEAALNVVNEHQEKVDAIKEQINEQRELIASRDKEMSEKKSTEKELRKRIKEIEAAIARAHGLIERAHAENASDLKERRYLEEKHSWIEQDKHVFGKKNTLYDFTSRDPVKAERHLNKARNQKEKLNGQINQRAMALLQQAENTYEELLVKREGVEDERNKLLQTIELLDVQKKEEVTKAYKEVNKNFGSIFSSLLPGATAQLRPPENKSVLEGLEFKVGFGNIWKDNLSELSGGQRSLVALSLILAMLLLKPAPIYILDEVDAALDLSHTQNIGSMLKRHFKQSQFIIVSLKDGMFENANVLYRTKFVDGVSTVTRMTSNNKRKQEKIQNKENIPRNRV